MYQLVANRKMLLKECLVLFISVFVSTETIDPLCQRGFKEVFSFGNSVYLVEKQKPQEIHQFNVEDKTFDKPISSLDSVIAGEFREIRFTISLSDFCLKSAFCTDSSWNELEKLILVKGNRAATYGFEIAELNIDRNDRKLKLLPEETISENIREKMSKLNMLISKTIDFSLPILPKLVVGPIPFINLPPYYAIGGVFVPSRAEMLILTANYRVAKPYPTYLFRRKFSNLTEHWSETSLRGVGLESDVSLIGLIKINETVHAVGWDSELFDIEWNDQDEISIKRSMYKLTNCPETVTPRPVYKPRIPICEF